MRIELLAALSAICTTALCTSAAQPSGQDMPTTNVSYSGQQILVHVSNASQQPVTAVAMTINHTDTNGGALTTFYFVDLEYAGASAAVMPGAGADYRFKSSRPGAPAPTVTVNAVVYRDGTSQGDKVWASRIIQRRKFLLDSLDAVIPVVEADVVAVRNKAARALQSVFRELGLTEITDAEVEAATYARGSLDMPPRNVVDDLKAAGEILKRAITGVDVVKALSKGGFDDVAASVLSLLRQRVAGDYLQTSAIFDSEFHVISAVNQPNDYAGPRTGFQVSDERWALLKNIRQAVSPESI